jgi:hypothetical protein
MRNGVPLVAELPVLGLSGDYYGSDERYVERAYETDIIQQFWADGSVTWRKKVTTSDEVTEVDMTKKVAVDVHGYQVEDDTDPQFDRWVDDGSSALITSDEVTEAVEDALSPYLHNLDHNPVAIPGLRKEAANAAIEAYKAEMRKVVPEATWQDAPSEEEQERMVGGGRMVVSEAWMFGGNYMRSRILGEDD